MLPHCCHVELEFHVPHSAFIDIQGSGGSFLPLGGSFSSNMVSTNIIGWSFYCGVPAKVLDLQWVFFNTAPVRNRRGKDLSNYSWVGLEAQAPCVVFTKSVRRGSAIMAIRAWLAARPSLIPLRWNCWGFSLQPFGSESLSSPLGLC